MKGVRAGWVLGVGVGVGVVVGVLFFSGWVERFFWRDWVGVGERIRGMGIWGPVVLVGVDIFFVLSFLPSTLVTVLAGLLFGWWGLCVSLAGLTLGMGAAFMVARYWGGWLLPRGWVGGGLRERLGGRIRAEGWRVVLVTRLFPANPFPLLNYLYGLTGISFWEYLWASVVGVTPITVFYTYLAIEAGRWAVGGGGEIWVLVMLGVGSVVLGLFFFLRRRGGCRG